MQMGILLADVPPELSPTEQIDAYLRQVEVGQEAGLTHFVLGQHFVYDGIPWHQPVPLLGRLAAATDDHVTIGTGVMLSPLYHPVVLAEEIATLDAVCGGRLVLGLGTGYREDEFTTLDIPFEDRIGRLEESVEVMRLMWANERVDHEGEHFHLSGVRTHLFPARPGGPPIWMGARSRGAVRRAARLGDAWLVTSKVPFDEVRERWQLYRSERERLDRPVTPLPANRQVMLGADRSDALERHLDLTSSRLDTYQDRGLVIDAPEIGETRDASRTAFLGTAEDCLAQVRDFVADVPVDPIFVRALWPASGLDGAVTYLEELGRELVPGLAEIDVSVPA